MKYAIFTSYGGDNSLVGVKRHGWRLWACGVCLEPIHEGKFMEFCNDCRLLVHAGCLREDMLCCPGCGSGER